VIFVSTFFLLVNQSAFQITMHSESSNLISGSSNTFTTAPFVAERQNIDGHGVLQVPFLVPEVAKSGDLMKMINK
jgi:hypothetical protein